MNQFINSKPSKKHIIAVLALMTFSIMFSNLKAEESKQLNSRFSSSPIDTGFNDFGDILAIDSYNGDMIVAGKFFNNGDGGVAGRIAGWNGTNWFSFSGIPLGPEVYALKEFNNELYIGTTFSQLYKWGGSSWLSVGPRLGLGLYGHIRAVDTFLNEIIVGGGFKFDTLLPSYIAKFNGSTWDTLGDGLLGPVKDLLVYNGNLIAGGQMTERIQMWNDTAWSSLGTGISGGTGPTIYAMTIYNGDLIVAGIFTTAGGISADNVARWDGSNWYSMTSQLLNKPCFALTVHNGVLYAAGGITGFVNGYVQEWTGSTWNYLTNVLQFDGWNYSLGSYDTLLVVGGAFDSTGGGKLAAWNGSTWEPLNGLSTSVPERINDLIPQKFSVSQNYPNPFNPTTTIEYDIISRTLVTITVYNTLGEQVKTLYSGTQSAGTYTIEWDGTNSSNVQVATGIYFYRIQAGELFDSKKMILMK